MAVSLLFTYFDCMLSTLYLPLWVGYRKGVFGHEGGGKDHARILHDNGIAADIVGGGQRGSQLNHSELRDFTDFEIDIKQPLKAFPCSSILDRKPDNTVRRTHREVLVDVANRILAIGAAVREGENQVCRVGIACYEIGQPAFGEGFGLECRPLLQAFRAAERKTAHEHGNDTDGGHESKQRRGERRSMLRREERRDEEGDQKGVAGEGEPRFGIQPRERAETAAIGDAAEQETIEVND